MHRAWHKNNINYIQIYLNPKRNFIKYFSTILPLSLRVSLYTRSLFCVYVLGNFIDLFSEREKCFLDYCTKHKAVCINQVWTLIYYNINYCVDPNHMFWEPEGQAYRTDSNLDIFSYIDISIISCHSDSCYDSFLSHFVLISFLLLLLSF